MLSLKLLSDLVSFCSYVRSLRTDPDAWPPIEAVLAPDKFGRPDYEERRRLEATKPAIFKLAVELSDVLRGWRFPPAWYVTDSWPSPPEPEYALLWNSITLGAGPPVNVVVFVHGIFSDAESAFGRMETAFHGDPALTGWLFAGFSYDFHAPMESNGQVLFNLLKPFTGINVHLVCHSMGGLVGRLAVLAGAGKNVRRLFLIGTPNHGAYRTSQLGLLSQTAFAMTGKLWGLFPKTGIRDLTRVRQIMREPVDKQHENAVHTEYITIPGTFFHSERAWWELPSPGTLPRMFWLLDKKMFLLDAALQMTIRPPHDGIVEHLSNRLQFDLPGSTTEKQSGFIYPNGPQASLLSLKYLYIS